MNTHETPDGKKISVTEHEDGRKDVTIGIPTINIDIKDEADAKAVKAINEKIIPGIAKARVNCIVIYKPTNESTSAKVSVVDVQHYVKTAIAAFPTPGGIKPDHADFVAVEVYESGHVRVSSIKELNPSYE